MKKILTILALCALVMSANATDYYYKCGVTKVEYEDQSYTKDGIKRNIYKVTINHTGKNMNGYSNTTVYDATVTFYLTSDDGTLDGTYTTEGFESIGSTYDKNYINYDNTKVKVDGYNERSLHPNKVSKLVINKEAGENQFSIGECTFYATNSKFSPTNSYTYYYCYDVTDIQNPNVALKPFVFGIQTEFVTAVYNYDMTVNGVSVMRDDTDYDSKRYFMIMNCTGKNRADNSERNYEVQLAIYPDEASIVGNFATQGGDHLMWASNSYVKDTKAGKQRNLANDSISSIQIKSKGENKYSFYGGTLICTDIDMNHLQVYQEKRIEAVHYYHFSDNDGAGIEFGYDESNTSYDLTASKVEVEKTTDDFAITVNAANENSVAYTLDIRIESETLAGTHQYNGTLGLWTKVTRGSNNDYAASGSTVYIVSKGGNTYTLSATILTENGFTYNLAAVDFTYGSSTATGMESIQHSAVSIQKVIRDGQMIILRDGKEYNVLGAENR